MDSTVTDTAATPAGPEDGPADSGHSEQDRTEDGEPGADIPKRRRWLRWTALGAAAAVLAAAGTAWSLYQRLDGNIRTDADTSRELEEHAADRPASVVREAVNILVIGSDNRGDGNGRYGRDSGTQRSDTTILLHLAADRKSGTAVSIPRDLMVEIPECTTSDGTTIAPRFAQFNWAFQFAGAGCTIRTVEQMTGIRMDHHAIVDFSGFTEMVDAIGGVEICLAEPVDDSEAHVELPAGRQTLNGEEALGYVRARYSLGDGTDTERMVRQQQFLATMLRQIQENGTLRNPSELFSLLDAATSSLTTDPGLASLKSLYDLADSLRGMPEGGMRFLTVPRQPYRLNANRDELVQPDASLLFEELKNDRPVTAGGGRDEEPGAAESTGAPEPTGSPTGGSAGGSGATPLAGLSTPAASAPADPASPTPPAEKGPLCG
ncbi:LCP family protein [Streptomyces xinghaiensis]|uniref:LCP family protein n=1 Tax=Streptomyces xinghaiensis TaxID=1038928 RepID=UPI000BAFFC6C|nr:LCP family protein [Streptomyces xinghaiensis]MZE78647.1 LytR family transcriptional regulator [Streptomyces sp. SID5475]